MSDETRFKPEDNERTQFSGDDALLHDRASVPNEIEIPGSADSSESWQPPNSLAPIDGATLRESPNPNSGDFDAEKRDAEDQHEAAAPPTVSETSKSVAHSSPFHLATSTLISLGMVVVLLVVARWLVPSLVEHVRYSWYRGQLRAEYELSDQRLQNVSLNSLKEVSQLVSHRVGPSLVHVNLVRDPESMRAYERAFQGSSSSNPNIRYEGQGSGFIIDEKGHILTNNHVLEGSGNVEVTLSDGRLLPATIIGRDKPTDLAVLKVDADQLMPVKWGNSEDVTVGTPVWAAGSPFGLRQTITFGIISSKHRIDFRGTHYASSVLAGSAVGDLMQSDVALNPGNSGGPLVNSLGEVVGVNAAIVGETYRGISFSIPSRVAERVAMLLIDQGEVPRGWLGVQMQDLAVNERYDESGSYHPGVRVVGFGDADSPARKAGVEIGDIIEKFNGNFVANQMELMRMIGEAEVGTEAVLTVRREDFMIDLVVKLNKRTISYNP